MHIDLNLTFGCTNKFGQVVYDTKDWTRKLGWRSAGEHNPTSDVYVWT